MNTDNIDSVRYQARCEIAMEKFFAKNDFSAFTNTSRIWWVCVSCPVSPPRT